MYNVRENKFSRVRTPHRPQESRNFVSAFFMPKKDLSETFSAIFEKSQN